MRKFWSLGIVLLFSGVTLSADAFVWKAQKEGSVIYLGGTVHLLRQSDFPLPAEFDTAYRKAQIVVFETDMGQMKDPAVQQKILLKSMYQDGTTVDQHLSPKAYGLLRDYCQSQGIAVESLRHLKPSIIMVTLMTMELMKMGIDQSGVDDHFYLKAQHDKKKVQWFETIDQQIDFVVGMGQGNEDALVSYFLTEMRNLNESFSSLVDAWKRGDAKTVHTYMIDDVKKKTPQIYRELLVERNRNWMPLIETFARTPQIEFILVGAAHLVGEEGILNALKKKGFTVTKL